MNASDAEWKETVVRLLALGSKLEGEGQYNIAKLVRAAADALTRRAAYHLAMPDVPQELAGEVEGIAAALSALGLDAALIAALRRGATGLRERRLTMIAETPHPFVCRTCGLILLAAPEEPCPTCGAWPSTFQRFLPVYWLDALEPLAALDRLLKSPRDVEHLMEGLSEAELTRRPADGGWSIRQAIAHLRDAQGLFEFRLALLLEQDDPSLESQAVFDWAARPEERPPTTAEIYGEYAASRARTVARLEKLGLREWERAGRHEEFGPVTVRQQASYFAVHEITHLPQLERMRLEAIAERSPG